MKEDKNKSITGVCLAVLATIIWSGNFIVARGIYKEIPPVSLAFYRWLTASMVIAPFAYKSFRSERAALKMNWNYLFWVALTGIAVFNTFVYIAGHYTSAVNLALIGTTSSPVFAIVLAAIFLNEPIRPSGVVGIFLCLTGLVLLLSAGSIDRLLAFRFSKGDWWILSAALSFAIYSTLVKRKPTSISAINFLFVVFISGTIMLLPFYIWEITHSIPIIWNESLLLIILYLGIGTSVISFLCWNAAIERLGAGRTALFGNLIPVFSGLEAVLILNEKISIIHVFSGVLVITGLAIATFQHPVRKFEAVTK